MNCPDSLEIPDATGALLSVARWSKLYSQRSPGTIDGDQTGEAHPTLKLDRTGVDGRCLVGMMKT